ncbi:MAG: hypothetical protein HY320_13015 [Armatimonadetes bacterium]|nr:hypothetical protein [Armatimonadota bacterium]
MSRWVELVAATSPDTLSRSAPQWTAKDAPRWGALPRLTGAVAAALLLCGLLLLVARDLLILGVGVPGTVRLPAAAEILLHNKLQGWLHIGGLPITEEFSWGSLRAGLLWEWLPAGLIAAGLLCLAVWMALRTSAIAPALPAPHRPRRWVPVAAALWITGVAALISWLAFERVPHVQDSIAQLFQARIFASGRLWATVPPHPEFFGLEFLVADRGRWYAQYPPGHAALLTIGVILGAPWLVNPILGGLAALPLYLAGRAAYGVATARLALLLYCLSPFAWFMSAEFMNHASIMLAVAVGLAATLVAARRPSLSLPLACAAGLALGLGATCRPLSAASLAPVMLVGCCWRPRRPQALREWRLPAGGFLTSFAVGVLPLLAFNVATTGSPFRFGYEAQWGTSGLGFGVSQWGPPHTPGRGLLQTWSNLDALGKYLFEWPVSSLWPLLGLLALRRRWRRVDVLLLAVPLVLAVAYFFYFYQDLCFGPRFLYDALPAIVLLCARGILALGRQIAALWSLPRSTGRAIALRTTLVCAAIGLAGNLPALAAWYGGSFWGTNALLLRHVRRKQVHHALVFILDANRAREARLVRLGVSPRVAHSAVVRLDGTWIDRQVLRALSEPPRSPADLGRALEAAIGREALAPVPHYRRRDPPWIDAGTPTASYTLGLIANGPDLERQDVIYALDLGEHNERLIRAFPDRQVWQFGWDPVRRRYDLWPAFPPLTARGD